ncbi:MAG: hypothetical protein R2873_29275 [Caldilineaceae bacterium]
MWASSRQSYFPMSGRAEDQAYPFPEPRIAEGGARGRVVIAQDMLYWRVIQGGLAGIASQDGDTCPAPFVYTDTPGIEPTPTPTPAPSNGDRPLADYINEDLTVPVVFPARILWRASTKRFALLSKKTAISCRSTCNAASPTRHCGRTTANPPGVPTAAYNGYGNTYWHDPGELLYTLALAYPYLDADLKQQTRDYVAEALDRYPPLENLPWSDPNPDWLHSGTQREPYAVPFRAQINVWPPPAVSMSAFYAVWLWSRNTGDWSYAQETWPQAKGIFASRAQNATDYYADLAGIIGYIRIAQHFDDTQAEANAMRAALQVMEDGRQFEKYRQYAAEAYLDPRGYKTGLSMPVFYGLTPEVGRYLREQTDGAAAAHIIEKETGRTGLRWWYLTRAGLHGEVGETSYLAPTAGWSHFLAHAYIQGDTQEQLRTWLDRPWTMGDLYSIQKTVATIHATPQNPEPIYQLHAPLVPN